ncbi:MAG: prephenate dehydratase [Rhodospirillaceae bacterium TMED8]|nr:prephenate dehydratase [Magnetovibrio sp.]OUT53251.1 MAG: prephenate dehydratase [Rhodospirillaceae bacterium TMED8]
MNAAANTISFQGMPGAYSMMACQLAYPDMMPLPCRTFEEAFQAVTDGAAKLAMIPIENSVAGRVADIHHLMPQSGLKIVAEHFQRVNHQLLGVEGATIEELTHVHSHVQALSQCRKLINDLGIEPVVHVDTAGAAEDVAAGGDKTQAAISSELAADLNSLNVLRTDVEDSETNTTRFVVLSREPIDPGLNREDVITTFVFEVRNIPASLYKALGGFATNGINITKLESYVDSDFNAAQFYADVAAHPKQESMQLAMEELQFFTHNVQILGTYPASSMRNR